MLQKCRCHRNLKTVLSKLQHSPTTSKLFSQHLCVLFPSKIAPTDYAEKQIIDDQWRILTNLQARHPEGLNEARLILGSLTEI